MFTVQNTLALLLGTLLGIGLPIAAMVIFKKKKRDAWLPSVFIGIATFLVFALILEQLLHLVMLPIVKNSTLWYCVYGVLAAGIFEETGRFVAYKTLMRKHRSTANAVFMGLGHGGFEAIGIFGFTMLSYLFTALTINGMGGIDAYLATAAESSPELAENAKIMCDTVSQIGFLSVIAPMYERIIAMVFHICMSVWVYKAAAQKGRILLYPAAVLTHALLDVPAVLYQTKVISNIVIIYAAMTVIMAVVALVTVRLTKKFPDEAR